MQRRTLLHILGVAGASLAALGGTVSATADEQIDLVGYGDPAVVEQLALPGTVDEYYATFKERVPGLEAAQIDQLSVDGVIRDGTLSTGRILAVGDIPVDRLTTTMSDDPLDFERVPFHNTSLAVFRASAHPLVVGVDSRQILLQTSDSSTAALTQFRSLLQSPRLADGFRRVPARLTGFDHAFVLGMDSGGRDRIRTHADGLSNDVDSILADTTTVGMGLTLNDEHGDLRYAVSLDEAQDHGATVDGIVDLLASDDRVDDVAVTTQAAYYEIDVTVGSTGVIALHEETFKSS